MRPAKLPALLFCLSLVACDSDPLASVNSWFDDNQKPATPASAPTASAPDPSVDMNDPVARGKAFMQSGQYDEARSSYEEATKKDSMNVHAWNGLGAANDMLGNKSDALDAYQHAFTLNPSDYSVVNNLGHLYIEVSNYEKAAKLLQPYADKPDAPEILRQNMATATEQMNIQIAQTTDTYADLGSYPTEAMAQGRIAEIKGLLNDNAVILAVVTDMKVAGGMPTYTIKATGRPPQTICRVMNAQAFPCVPYGKGM